MIKFKEIQKEAKKQGHNIEREDFLFALFVVQGYDLDQCAILSGKYTVRSTNVRVNPKKADTTSTNAKMKAKKLLEEEHIKWLVIALKPMHLDDTKKFVFANMDSFDFIPKTAKQNLVDESLINKLMDSGSEEDLSFDTIALRGIKKNIMAILKSDIELADKAQVDTYLKAVNVAVQRLLPPAKDEDAIDYFSKNFQYVYPKMNCVCVECNREFDGFRGMIVKCPHCGTQYDMRE